MYPKKLIQKILIKECLELQEFKVNNLELFVLQYGSGRFSVKIVAICVHFHKFKVAMSTVPNTTF